MASVSSMRHGVILSLVTSVVGLACGSARTSDPDDGKTVDLLVTNDLARVAAARSGTRLRLQMLRSADGIVDLAGLFDTALGVPCRFVLASDQRLRCLPWSRDLDPRSGGPDWLPVPARDAACAPNADFQGVATDTCAGTPVTHRATPSVEVDPATFVEGGEQRFGGGRLVARTIAGADGSRYPIGWFDTELDAPCTIVAAPRLDTTDYVAPDGSPAPNLANACVPPLVSALEIDCGKPNERLGVSGERSVVDRMTCSRAPTDFVVDHDLAATPHVFKSGAPVPDASVVTSCNQGGCACGPAPNMVGLGDDVTARLVVVAPRADGGPRLRATGEAGIWQDSARNELCRFARAKDGSIRCLPIGPRGTPIFEGSSCAGDPYALALDDSTSLDVLRQKKSDLCASERVFAVVSTAGVSYPATWSSLGGDGQCWPPPSETVGTGPPHNGEIGSLAKVHEIDPGELVEATLVTQ
jgi:hypothetical protein